MDALHAMTGSLSPVMAGHDPAITLSFALMPMAGSSPAMTRRKGAGAAMTKALS
jgi:hypothetical protein